MKKSVQYRVRVAGENSTFTPCGWGGYNKRWAASNKGKLRGLIYGVQQAREHIRELRRHVYMGKCIYLHSTFEIVKIVTTETQVALVHN